MFMELIQYIRLFRKWFWLILLATFVAGSVSFIVSSGRPPVYEASTTIAIGQFIQSPNPNSSDITVGIGLAQTYAKLITTYDVLQGTIDTLDLPLDVNQLERLIRTQILTGTSLMVVTVTYNDPVLVADIANGLAKQLVLHSPTNLTPEQQTQIDFANAQIADLNQQLGTTRNQLKLIDDQIASSGSSDTLAALQEQRNSLITQINQASATIAQFSSTITTLQERTNSLDIVEQARVPATSSGASVITTTLLGAIVGATLAIGLALLIEYLDDTIRTSEIATQILALPVLGGIVRFGKKTDDYAKRLVTSQPSASVVSEGYRTIRTNLMFNADSSSKGIYAITSPNPEEGKSITASNIAITMAQAGLQVLLIDCDLRRPKLHEVFGLKNDIGLTTLLSANPQELRNEKEKLQKLLYKCIQTTKLAKLWLITSGFIPQNPTELLGSASFQSWVKMFRNFPEIDVVIFDTPPCLIAADSSVLAATSKAEVVMVIDARRTRRGAALKAKQQFTNLGLPIRGVVMNRINLREESYDYGYNYNSAYYYTEASASANRLKGIREKLLGKSPNGQS
jgi:polysaccharide biosynthesis transport protein